MPQALRPVLGAHTDIPAPDMNTVGQRQPGPQLGLHLRTKLGLGAQHTLLGQSGPSPCKPRVPSMPSSALLATQGAREMGWFMDEFSRAAGLTPAIVTGKVRGCMS